MSSEKQSNDEGISISFICDNDLLCQDLCYANNMHNSQQFCNAIVGRRYEVLRPAIGAPVYTKNSIGLG
jgi:hypothetical protein